MSSPSRAADPPDLHRVERVEDLPDPAPDATYVVVDVIISSTTIVELLAAGARYVRPFADVEPALAFKRETPDAVLVGEQGGQAVDGFDGSPLPSLLAEHGVDGAPVGILSSNGTRGMDRIGHEKDIHVGSTVNAAAVARTVADRDEVWLVAAGRGGEPTPEDSAGVDLVEGHLRGDPPDADRLAETIRGTETAAWLRDLGFAHEVDDICEFSSRDVVPRLKEDVFVAD